MNETTNHQTFCMNQIYVDPRSQDAKNSKNSKWNKKSFPKTILSQKKTLTMETNEEPIKVEQIEDNCVVCNDILVPGEVVYFCACPNFYHPYCISKQSKTCLHCNIEFKFGIYKLKCPKSWLNNSTEITRTTSVKNEDIIMSPSFTENKQILPSTSSKTWLSMDTNINNWENYDKMCDLAMLLNSESIAEIIRIDNDITMTNIKNSEINNRGNNIFMNNNNNNSHKASNNGNNSNELKRVALSPINIINTPYTGKGKSSTNTSTTDYFGRFINHNNSINNISPDINWNKIRQHLTFCSNHKCGTTENKDQTNHNSNHSLYSILENSYISNSNVNHLNNTISYRNWDFEEINDEVVPDDNDKENHPPLPKENSHFDTCSLQECTSFWEMNIEGGLSHIISDTCKTVDIPITIDLKPLENSNYEYSKNTVLIFNTIELNLETILLILKSAYDKMNKFDSVFSNIFKNGKLYSKEEMFNMLSTNNIMDHIQETSTLDFKGITNWIQSSIDLACEFHSNIFSLWLINDIDEIGDGIDYSSSIKEITDKLQTSKINVIQQFTMNVILLDENTKIKSESNVRFVSFLYDLSMLCMGFFYSPKDANEWMKAICLFYTTLQQMALLNWKLTIKGNKDPSIQINTLNYPSKVFSHNNIEVYLGSLLWKEKKVVNINATVLLNTNINLTLPIFEISCEYFISKSILSESDVLINKYRRSPLENSGWTDVLNNKDSVGNARNCMSLVRNRTNFLSFGIPIIPKNKEISYSNSVFLRNITAKAASNISDGIQLFAKSWFEDAAIKFSETKVNFDNMIKLQKCLFNNLTFHAEQVFNKSWNMSSMLSYSNVNDEENSWNFTLSTLTNNANISKILSFVMMWFNDWNYWIDSSKNRKIENICLVYSIGEALSFYRSVMLGDERFIVDNYKF